MIGPSERNAFSHIQRAGLLSRNQNKKGNPAAFGKKWIEGQADLFLPVHQKSQPL